MKQKSFDEILKYYILYPDSFWPDDTVFHRRNREKLVKARARVGDIDNDVLQARLKYDLEKRYEEKRKTLYVISCGSSGCHFLGEMLSSIGSFDLVKEVYYPPDLLHLCREGDFSEKERMMLFDLVSYFPSRGVKNNEPDVVPVNVMHLRPDTPTEFVRSMGGHHLILLMRNPFDVAYSRAFRKDDYRADADPGASDKEYLVKQANTVRRFYRLAAQKKNPFDYIVRYEDLVGDARSSLHDLLFVAKEKFPEEWEASIASSKIKFHARSENSINFNPEKKKNISPELSEILISELQELAENLGYKIPDYLS